MVYSLVEFCYSFGCCTNSISLLWEINASYIYSRRKTRWEAPRAGRWPCFLCTKSDLTFPCITVHLMELRRDLTVDRVGSSCPCRSVPVLTQWLGDTSRTCRKSSRPLALVVFCTTHDLDFIRTLLQALAWREVTDRALELSLPRWTLPADVGGHASTCGWLKK